MNASTIAASAATQKMNVATNAVAAAVAALIFMWRETEKERREKRRDKGEDLFLKTGPDKETTEAGRQTRQ